MNENNEFDYEELEKQIAETKEVYGDIYPEELIRKIIRIKIRTHYDWGYHIRYLLNIIDDITPKYNNRIKEYEKELKRIKYT